MPRRRRRHGVDEREYDSQEEEENWLMRNAPQAQSRPLHPEEVKALISEFNGENAVTSWLRKLDHYKTLYNWTDAAALLYATTRLTGSAKLWYNSVEEDIFNFHDFKEMIAATFPNYVDDADIHRELMAAMKSNQESYEGYVFRMQNIASKGQMSQSSLIKYIISGLSRDKLYEQIVSAEYRTVMDLLKRLKWCEANFRMKKPNYNVARISQASRPTGNDGRTAALVPVTSQAGSSDWVCFNCNAPGHKSVNCPKPQRRSRCACCSKVGHQEDTCPDKKPSTFAPKLRVAMISASNQDQPAANEGIDTDEDGMMEGEAIIGRRLKQLKLLVDSGSAVSLIKHSALAALVRLDKEVANNREIIGVNSSKICVEGCLKTKIVLFRSLVYDVSFYVVPDETMEVSAILGRDFMKRNNLSVIRFSKSEEKPKSEYDSVLMNTAFGENALNQSVEEELCLIVGDNEETVKFREEILRAYQTNYCIKKSDYGKAVQFTASIRLREEKYYNVSPQRLCHAERKVVESIVAEWLDKGIIRESDSPYSSRIVLVKKKNGSFRLCVDFKSLNRLVERDHFPLPVIEDQIAKLDGMKYFSTMDMKNGFFHVDLTEDSKKYTSFVTENGQFEFNKLPFGYTNAPAIFSRYVAKILHPFVKSGELIVFMDDIMLCSKTVHQHLDLLRRVFATLKDNGVKLNLEKSRFLVTRVDFLGYSISFNQISPCDRHVEAVREIPVPQNAKSLQRFLGLMSYFRKFIKGFSTIASPLYDLLKKDAEYFLGAPQLEAVEKLKKLLISRPVLCIYSPNTDTQLHTDASSQGFGGILMQRQRIDNKYHPVMFFSRKTNSAESKLHSFELETLAIVYALKRFRHYVTGIPFEIVTDCKSLKQTLEKRISTRKLQDGPCSSRSSTTRSCIVLGSKCSTSTPFQGCTFTQLTWPRTSMKIIRSRTLCTWLKFKILSSAH